MTIWGGYAAAAHYAAQLTTPGGSRTDLPTPTEPSYDWPIGGTGGGRQGGGNLGIVGALEPQPEWVPGVPESWVVVIDRGDGPVRHECSCTACKRQREVA